MHRNPMNGHLDYQVMHATEVRMWGMFWCRGGAPYCGGPWGLMASGALPVCMKDQLGVAFVDSSGFGYLLRVEWFLWIRVRLVFVEMLPGGMPLRGPTLMPVHLE